VPERAPESAKAAVKRGNRCPQQRRGSTDASARKAGRQIAPNCAEARTRRPERCVVLTSHQAMHQQHSGEKANGCEGHSSNASPRDIAHSREAKNDKVALRKVADMAVAGG